MKALEETGKLEGAAPTAAKRHKKVAEQINKAQRLTPIDTIDKKVASEKNEG